MALNPGETYLASSAARTATGNGATQHIPGPAKARVFLDVTAASGTTPTLDVTVEGEVDGQTYTIGTFTQKTGVTKDSIALDHVPSNVRARWVVGGTTPSFTFSVVIARTPDK